MSLGTLNTRIPGSVLMAGLLALPPLAHAQSPGSSAPADVKPPYWEIIGGFEGDTHHTGYGFFGPQYNHPIKDNLAITARVFGSYLYYSFDNNLGGETKVHSPGFAPAIGLRFGRGTTFKVAVGYSGKSQHREIFDGAGRLTSDTTTWKSGLSLGGDVYWNLTKRDNVHALASFNTSDDYLWSRAGYKHQMSNHDWRSSTTFYLGGEVIAQGNDDIRSNSVGALAEVLFVPSRFSVMFRGGYKRSTFPRGDDKSGPYYGVGIYKRF
jgi:hypothetical protein